MEAPCILPDAACRNPARAQEQGRKSAGDTKARNLELELEAKEHRWAKDKTRSETERYIRS